MYQMAYIIGIGRSLFLYEMTNLASFVVIETYPWVIHYNNKLKQNP